MSSSPRISVIIPVYNGEKLLEKTLKSVFGQTYPAHEIIVVDDGSTDSTPRLLERMGNKIKTRRIENAGAAAARNAGMELATGDYLAFLDADDLWFKHRLERQAEFIRQYPETGFFCCDFIVRYDYLQNRLVYHYSTLKNPAELNFDTPLKKDAFTLLVKEHFVGTSSAVVLKKEVAKKAGFFDTRYKSAQDYDYWLRCSVLTNFVVLSDALLYKKNHPTNISSNALRQRNFHKQVLQNTMKQNADYVREHGARAAFLRELAKNNYIIGNLQFESGLRFEAFRSYWEGLCYRPTPRNLLLFLKAVAKKSVRVLTFGILTKTNLKRLGLRRIRFNKGRKH